MKSSPSRSVALHLTIPVPQGGATALPLSHYLKRLADDITVAFMDSWKSVPSDAESLQLSITVSATGEPPTNESLISMMQPGQQSQMHPADSSKSPSDQSDELAHQMGIAAEAWKPSQTQHTFIGNTMLNCERCGMPLGAFQHSTLHITPDGLVATDF